MRLIKVIPTSFTSCLLQNTILLNNASNSKQIKLFKNKGYEVMKNKKGPYFPSVN